jgi:hypothetical protein
MQENNEIKEIKELLVWFIKEQKLFNEEQKLFNEKIDKKIDKVQYFLEETIADNAKMFFEEQIEMKNYIRELEWQIKTIKSQMLDLSNRVNLLFKA